MAWVSESDPRVARRSLQPLARVSVLAVPGGALVGLRAGALLAAVMGAANALASPSDSMIGYAIVSSLVGAALGLIAGLVIGGVVAGALALMWAVGVPGAWSTVIGTVALAGAAFVLLIVPLPTFDPAWSAVVSIGVAEGIAGVVLLGWIAGQRPGRQRGSII